MDKKQIMQYLEYIKLYNIRNDDDVKNISKLINEILIDYDIKVEKLQKLQLAWKMSDKKDKESFKNKEGELFELLKIEKEIIIYFGHKYSQMKMNIKPSVNIIMNKNQPLKGASAFFREFDWSITYDVTSLDINGANILGTVFHEMRHANQSEYISSYRSNVDFDPLFIMIAKERILRSYKLLDYGNNHENFIAENDANLYGKYLLDEFSKKYLNGLYDLDEIKAAFDKSEQTNFSNYRYGELLNDSDDISYNSEKDNNRIILTDKKLMELIREKPDIINGYPILKYVYNPDGNKKTYQEIINDKNILFEKNKDNNLLNAAYSYSDYNYASKTKREHIETIYKLIISSDPLLWVEDCLNKKSYNRLNHMLEDNQIIVEEYKSAIIEIISKYNDGTPIFNKLLSSVGFINNNQNTTINNHEEEIIDLVPNEINELFIKYVHQHYKEIIGYDNLSYDEIAKEEEQIREGINPKINGEILKLKKIYIEIKKGNPDIGYSDFFNHLYPHGEPDEIEQIDVVETVDRPKY